MKKAFAQVLTRIGDPLDKDTLYGPLHSQNSVNDYNRTIEDAKKLGGKIEFGGKVSARLILLLMVAFLIYMLPKWLYYLPIQF